MKLELLVVLCLVHVIFCQLTSLPLTSTPLPDDGCPKSDSILDSELAQDGDEEDKTDIAMMETAKRSGNFNKPHVPLFVSQGLRECPEPPPSTGEADVPQEQLQCPPPRNGTADTAARAKRQIGFVKRCDACPATQRLLRRHGSCYVLAWSLQHVRTVDCPQRPWWNQVCDCGNPLEFRQICVKTHWIRVWFWAWCPSFFNLPWGYHWGLNYNFRWLPQECQCRCYRRRC